MPRYLQYATISEESARHQEWQEVFGSNVVPITNALHPYKLSILGEEREAYMLALDELTPLQRSKLIHHIAVKFGIPTAEVEATIDAHGVPILTDDVSSVCDPRLIL